MIYFDHNATTPVRPEVLAAMMPHLGGLAGNPSSLHAAGRRARSDVDKAREQVAVALGCAPGEVCFTSGGTESDNWAIKGVVSAARAAGSRRRRIVTSSIEHHAVWHACEHLQELGMEVAYAPVDAEGTVLPEGVEELIDDETLLVSVMHANNETGRLQPVAGIAAAARERGSLFHVDAVQSFGKLPWRAADLGADLISISAHKINGPKGVGALCVRPGIPLHPLAHGGGHEGGLRAGTENVAGIVGFGAAAALAQEELQGPGETPAKRVGRLRDQLEAGILASLESVEINGRSAGAFAAGGDPGRLPNTCNAAFRGVEAEAIILGLDLEGIAVASGSACTSGAPEPSHVLLAMGLEPRLAASSVRFSLGWGNTEAEVACCLELLPGIVGRLRELSTEPV
jgi:cysteine desulfurase